MEKKYSQGPPELSCFQVEPAPLAIYLRALHLSSPLPETLMFANALGMWCPRGRGFTRPAHSTTVLLRFLEPGVQSPLAGVQDGSLWINKSCAPLMKVTHDWCQWRVVRQEPVTEVSIASPTVSCRHHSHGYHPHTENAKENITTAHPSRERTSAVLRSSLGPPGSPRFSCRGYSEKSLWPRNQ